jgi:hypothetical protein
MTKRRSAKWLAKAVLNGDWTFDAATEEHLHENYRGPLDILPHSKMILALCYAVMGWQDRQIVIWGEPFTVGEVIKEFGLEPFVPMFDRTEGARFQKGEIVTYEREQYRVIGRREVSPLADHGFDAFEVFIEQLSGDGTSGFVGEDTLEEENDETTDETPE